MSQIEGSHGYISPGLSARLVHFVGEHIVPGLTPGRRTDALRESQRAAAEIPRQLSYPHTDMVATYRHIAESPDPAESAHARYTLDAILKMNPSQCDAYFLTRDLRSYLLQMCGRGDSTDLTDIKLRCALHVADTEAATNHLSNLADNKSIRPLDFLQLKHEYYTPHQAQDLITGTETKTALFHPTEHERRVGQFLGYTDESTLMRSLPSDIFQLLIKNGVPQSTAQSVLRRYTQVLDYIAPLHDTFNKARHSKERYCAHLARTCWYTLSALTHFDMLPRDEQSLKKWIDAALLHDAEEDIRDKQGHHAAHYMLDPNKSGQMKLTCPTDANGSHYTSLDGIHPDTAKTLGALNSARSKEGDELYHVVIDDPTGMAAFIKCYGDRIDNMMTMWYHKSYIGYHKKLLETVNSMSAIGTFAHHALQSKRLYPLRHALAEEFDQNRPKEILAPYLLAESQIASSLNKLTQEMRKRAGIPTLTPTDRRYERIKAQDRWSVQNGEVVFQSEFPDRFSIAALAEDYMKRQSRIKSSRLVGERPMPFGFADIARFVVQSHPYTKDFYPVNTYDDQYRRTAAHVPSKGNNPAGRKLIHEYLQRQAQQKIESLKQRCQTVFTSAEHILRGSEGFLP